MKFIPEKEADALRSHLAKTLGGPVTLDLFIQSTSPLIIPGRTECDLCEETLGLLEDVASLSDRVALTVHDIERDADLAREMGVTRVPAIVLRGTAKGSVRYLGIPAGLEFGTLLEGLAAVGSGTTTLTPESREKLAGIAGPVHVQVFVTPTCPYCPKVATLAHQAAVESPHVTADVVEVSEFPELARRYRVQGVPKIVINDTVELVGAQPESALVAAMLQAAASMPRPVEA